MAEQAESLAGHPRQHRRYPRIESERPTSRSIIFSPEDVVLPSPGGRCEGHESWEREGPLLTRKVESSRGIKGCHYCSRHFPASFKGEEPLCMTSSPRYEGTLQSWLSQREHSAQHLSTRASLRGPRELAQPHTGFSITHCGRGPGCVHLKRSW